MTTALGLVCVPPEWHVLRASASFRPGAGRLHLRGPVGGEIRVTLLAAISAIHELDSYVDGFDSSIFGTKDLHIRMAVNELDDCPVVGESYGLALAIAILAAAVRRTVPQDIIFTGCLGPAGEVLPVEFIDEKRKAASKLRFNRIMLPATQLDMMSSDINQIPVNCLREAFSLTFFGDDDAD